MEEASDETDTESVESFGAQLVEAFERQKRKAEEAAEAVELAKRKKVEAREALKAKREEAGTHTAFCGEVRLEKAVDGDGWKHVSSFGRIESQFGARYFVTPGDHGYGVSKVKGVGQIPVHVLVNVLFNDPGLRTYERGMTTDHFDQNRANNYKGNLAFKTHSEQIANRTISEAGKLNRVKVLGHAVQGQVVDPDGTRGEWQTWDAQLKAAEGTMMSDASVCKSIKEDCVVQSAQTGISWYFRPLQREDPDGAVWTRHPAVDGVEFDLVRGVYRRDGCGAETKGTKNGSYRSMEIDGDIRQVHDILGELIHGPRPSDKHTMEHVDKTLDADGCLSNAAANLGGWFSKKEQAATSGNGSKSETQGKPVAARRKSDGALLGPWANLDLAGEELGLSLQMISAVCYSKFNSKDYEIWFVPQPDLLRVTATMTVAPGGRVKLSLTPEREEWKRVNPKDWAPKGKYHRIIADNKSTGGGKRLPGLL